MSEKYYRLYVNHEDTPVIAGMQPCDELVYDQERFINNEKYETKEQAKKALRELRSRAGLPFSNLEKLKIAQQESNVCTFTMTESFLKSYLEYVQTINVQNPGKNFAVELRIALNSQCNTVPGIAIVEVKQ